LKGLVRVSEVRLLDLERLLGLGDALALARDPALKQPHRLLRLRKLCLLLREPAPRLVQALARRREPSLPVAKRLALLDLVLAAGVALRAGLRELGLDSLAGFRDEADLGLDPGHVGVGAVELALRGRESVARGVMIGARKLELAFALAQASRLGFELDPDALDIARVALRLGVRLVAPQEPEQILLLRAVGRKLVVAPRDLG